MASPSDAFQAEVVFTMLSDDAAIRDVLLAPDVLRQARPGVVHVVTATISVDSLMSCEARMRWQALATYRHPCSAARMWPRPGS